MTSHRAPAIPAPLGRVVPHGSFSMPCDGRPMALNGSAFLKVKSHGVRRVRPQRIFQSGILAMAAVLLATGATWARSPFAIELETFSKRYHEDPARLDTIRGSLGQALVTDARPEVLIALAQVCFIWGDVRATTSDQKLDAYDQGRQAARRAIELEPTNAVAHLWYATNTARWGQTKGILRSLFLLPTVQEGIQRVLILDPGLVPVYALAGNVYNEVPAILGGDIDKAEQMFRKGLELDPRFTGMRVGLAKTLIRRGRLAEARRELHAVLDEKSPHNLADWALKDAKEARELLESIQGKS